MPPEVQKIFNMDPNMATVPFGHASKFMVPLLVVALEPKNLKLIARICEKLVRILS